METTVSDNEITISATALTNSNLSYLVSQTQTWPS